MTKRSDIQFKHTTTSHLLSLGLSALLIATTSHAEFALNFSGSTSTTIAHGGSYVYGQSPFTSVGGGQAGQYVTDPSNGLSYWHYVLGNPATGFAQEVYIQATTSSCGQHTICSASGGSAATPFATNVLGTGDGNGSGNPNRVITRMVVGGSWDAATSTWTCDSLYCSEFVKSAYANKPKITQGINDADFTSSFILDMSSIVLSDNTTTLTQVNGSTAPTGSSLTNVQTVVDANSASTFSFDMARDGQVTNVNGGKYTYTPGSGVLGAVGTYVYVDGQYNQLAVDASVFIDSTLSNPWAYPSNKP